MILSRVIDLKFLHIHQDYPDGRAYPYTLAVKNLLDETAKHNSKIDNFVLSINRTSNPFKISIKSFSEGVSLVYWALPINYLYIPTLWFWSKIVCLYLKTQNFNIVHSHKLTTEGVFGFFISSSLKTEHVVSIRGGSDKKNINNLYTCRYLYRKIYQQAKTVFYVSPWYKNELEKRLKVTRNELVRLPNICVSQSSSIETLGDNYLIVLSYHQYKRKGILQLLEALCIIFKDNPNVCLDIVGTGEPKYLKIIKDKINRLGISDKVNLLGSMKHSDLLHYIKSSRALILPATNETFGMVYIEAVSCSVPILYVANTGIDGYLDEVNVGVRIELNDRDSIVSGVFNLEKNIQMYKANLLSLNRSNYFNIFSKEIVAKDYLENINDILSVVNR